MLVVTLAPQRLTAIENFSAPWNIPLIFLITLLAWAGAAFGLWQTWRITGRHIDGLMALIAVWFMIGTISMHQYPVFHLSWWLYHLLILAGSLTAMFALAGEYEQFRRFSLTRYYALTSLVVMAALALLTSYFFTELIYHDLADIQAVVRVRLMSLLIASFSMGVLFLVLLTIVRRADQLITARAEELVQAYADLRAAEQNGTTLFVSVADDGEGVPVAYADRIFDKFTQLTGADEAPLRNGVGLGLAFCKLAIEAHGGRIWLDKEREKGSRFVFTLPLPAQSVI